MTKRTQEEIKDKGFKLGVTRSETNEEYQPIDYSKIRVGTQFLNDALVDINYFKKVFPKADKETILRAILNNNQPELRELSNFFFRSSGIYSRLCRYMAYLYKYDWMITPIILSQAVNSDKVVEGFYKSINYLDAFSVKKVLGNISLKVIKNGCYYGYKLVTNGTPVLQDLPVNYCRSRYTVNGKPAVEFNMRYFDDTFSDTNYRMRILKLFPAEVQKGYALYRAGKLPVDYPGDQQGWYLLDVANTVRFNINNDDTPMLISVLPAILDLEEAKELDRKKMLQQLLKIIVQKMPMDKNGELVFDVDEAQMLHNNAVKMLGQAIGVDVLTTFADVDSIDLADRSTTTTIDEINKVERAVFNEAGISQKQFNTDGNLALEKSIANDEASMSNLMSQFEEFLNELMAPFNKSPKKLIYKVSLLPTTIYNYKDLAKLYGDQMKVGFSKMLPQIALGQSQSVIIANAYFENQVLDLNSLFIPPLMSSTMSGKSPASGSEDGAGRPELPNDQKSEKTLQNNESMS